MRAKRNAGSVFPMVTYYEGVELSSLLDYAREQAETLATETQGAANALAGLSAGKLDSDPETALMALRLFASVISSASDALEQTVVDLYYSDPAHRPAVNEIARSAGVSVTTVKNWAERAERVR